MKGNKSTSKKQNYNEDILIKLEIKYGYSIDYMRKCLRGDRVGVMPDKIKAEYNSLNIAAKKAIEEASKNL